MITLRFLPDRYAELEWGGKGASLARLIRAGYAVPPTAAFGLTSLHKWLLENTSYQDSIAIARKGSLHANEALQTLRAQILSSAPPSNWAQIQADLKKRLCGGLAWPLIYRSSASFEDSATRSFAGAFESHRASDDSQGWIAFTQVLASAFEPQAIDQVLAAGLDPAELRMAIVVQPELQAELSGVCFSRDPAAALGGIARVHYHAGSGEGLVQGDSSGSEWTPSEGPPPGSLAPFAGALLSKIAKLERRWGFPVDVEWVWDGAQLWFVQARPIADPVILALYPATPGSKPKLWSRELAQERFPEPLTPMGWSALQDAFKANLLALGRRLGIRAGAPESMAISVRGVIYSDPHFFKFPADAQGGVRVEFKRLAGLIWKVPLFCRILLLRTNRSTKALLLSAVALDAMWSREADALEQGWQQHLESSLQAIRSFEQKTAASQKTGLELLAQMDEAKQIGEVFMEPDLAVFVIKDTALKILEKIAKTVGQSPERFWKLASEFEGNRTLMMQAQWKRTAFFLRQDPACLDFFRALGEGTLGTSAASSLATPAAAHAWNEFVAENGHLTTTWDVYRPSWADDREAQLSLVKNALGPELSPRLQGQSKLGGWDRWVLEAGLGLHKFLGLQHNSALAQTLQALLERLAFRAESFMRIDEEHHFYSGMLIRPSRTLLLRAGAQLVAEGLLSRSDDVFFLTLPELKGTLNRTMTWSLRFLAERRRAEFERSCQHGALATLPSRLGQTQGDYQEESQLESADGVFDLTSMSAGQVTGPLVWADHPSEISDLPTGAILLTTTPNPSWTPWYSKLGGLICITGGALSHGFVAARETGLPAVTGAGALAKHLTHCIAKDPNQRRGWKVEMNAAKGRVKLIPPDAAPPAQEHL